MPISITNTIALTFIITGSRIDRCIEMLHAALHDNFYTPISLHVLARGGVVNGDNFSALE